MAYLARVRPDSDRLNPLAGPHEELAHLLRLRERVTIPRHDVKRHAFNSEFDEQRGSNMTDAPELHLTRPKLHRRVDLAVDGDELAVSPNLDVLNKEEALLQTS